VCLGDECPTGQVAFALIGEKSADQIGLYQGMAFSHADFRSYAMSFRAAMPSRFNRSPGIAMRGFHMTSLRD